MTNVEFLQLVKTVDRLLSKNGCKWDRSQDLLTLRGFVLEEALELIDALERKDIDQIEEELGDILYQIIFISRLTKKRGSLKRTIKGIRKKLIGRHPHIFKEKRDISSDEVVKKWEEIKIKEKKAESIGYGILRTFPALLSAYKLGVRSESFNFDWDNIEQVFDKLNEEIEELKAELRKKRRDQSAIEYEIGDVLFVIANIARHLGINPEIALRKTNRKFIRRFDEMHRLINENNKDIKKLNIDEMESYWQLAKRHTD